MFIEPKGTNLKEHDKWKEDFFFRYTKMICRKTIDYNSDKYRLTRVSLYTIMTENEFITEFKESLNAFAS